MHNGSTLYGCTSLEAPCTAWGRPRARISGALPDCHCVQCSGIKLAFCISELIMEVETQVQLFLCGNTRYVPQFIHRLVAASKRRCPDILISSPPHPVISRCINNTGGRAFRKLPSLDHQLRGRQCRTLAVAYGASVASPVHSFHSLRLPRPCNAFAHMHRPALRRACFSGYVVAVPLSTHFFPPSSERGPLEITALLKSLNLAAGVASNSPVFSAVPVRVGGVCYERVMP